MATLAVSVKRNEPVADIAGLAGEAMYREVMLTPKPGLVDGANNGAHRDMNLALFMASIAAVSPWFARFFAQGKATAHFPAPQTLAAIRPVGLACEQAMFNATGGINTHKGGVFSLGLLCAAAGRLASGGRPLNQRALCREISAICTGLVDGELKKSTQANTKGEHIFQTLGLTGARGEAESGFTTVTRFGLPQWEKALRDGLTEQDALLRMLLALMAHNPDTNVVSRGGLNGLKYVQRYAGRLLQIRNLSGERLRKALIDMDNALIAKNLSPGGSADLLAVGWVLSHYPA
ncbi:triphosphoribosyl-dephospho-CoA synthase CitG [Mixta tenebrionis]|uniref:Probable 2-(5''-triphosphoribosyl)-3'-dephosphocoenzyme-A synthase n=1 Tax=Mixta tenebrionis TaxID=2562439 RepID=A0A506VE51_9GAMM|nr:triphosphoribosyl-dephospho-CoA synthase CitG [Mixta tenebrionis]TPW43686.1 triphosphoribosyl-dephospho-CoA synthase CitG [Mixta tenebrionis]